MPDKAHFLQVLQDQIDTIVKVSATTTKEQDPSSAIGHASDTAMANRRALQERLVSLFTENGNMRKHKNSIKSAINGVM